MKDQKGAALVAVLALVATCSIIAATIALLSQIHAAETDTHCKRGLSRYTAESSINRIIWLLAADKKIYSESDGDHIDYSSFSHDRYAPDSVIHTMEFRDCTIRFTVEDACRGLDMTNAGESLQGLQKNRETETAISDAVSEINDLVTDYTDSDDVISADGMESEDYEAEGHSPLPRNGTILTKEELLWLKDAERFFPVDSFGRLTSVMPLQASSLEERDTRPSLYTATYTELLTTGGLTPQEACTVLESLERWKNAKEPLEDTLDGTLYSGLQNNFRLEDSGAVQITIEHAAPEDSPSVRLSVTLPTPDGSVPENNRLAIWEWLWM